MKNYRNYSHVEYGITASKGNQVKFCDEDLWYKIDFLGYEGAAEYICSELLKQTNITDFIEYKLAQIKINEKVYMGCVSKNFLKDGETLVTADKLFKTYRNISIEEKLRNMGTAQAISYFVSEVEEITGIPEYGKYLTTMLEWDAFVLNEDRHFNNIAFIYDGKSYRPAPLFDNGAALLSDTRDDYPLQNNVYGLIPKVYAKPFSKDFDKQIDIAKKLYGSNLKFIKDLEIPQHVEQTIRDLYGNKIFDRINLIFQHQRYLSDIPQIKASSYDRKK